MDREHTAALALALDIGGALFLSACAHTEPMSPGAITRSRGGS